MGVTLIPAPVTDTALKLSSVFTLLGLVFRILFYFVNITCVPDDVFVENEIFQSAEVVYIVYMFWLEDETAQGLDFGFVDFKFYF